MVGPQIQFLIPEMGIPRGGFEDWEGNECEGGGGKCCKDNSPAPSVSGGVAITDDASPPIIADDARGGGEGMDPGEGAPCALWGSGGHSMAPA